MLAAGFLDEVARLRARADLHGDLPAMRAVGYRQAWEHLQGTTSANEFRNRSIFATRQLAKRQITWLRGDPALRVFDPDRVNVAHAAIAAVALFLAATAMVRGASSEAAQLARPPL